MNLKPTVPVCAVYSGFEILIKMKSMIEKDISALLLSI